MKKIPAKVKAGCGALFLFFTGVVSGGVGIILFLATLIPKIEGWNTDESKDFIASHIVNQLKLTKEQEAKLRPSFDQFLEAKWERRAESILAEHEEAQKYVDEIRSSLTPEQQKRADRLLKRQLRDKKRFLPASPKGELEAASR